MLAPRRQEAYLGQLCKACCLRLTLHLGLLGSRRLLGPAGCQVRLCSLPLLPEVQALAPAHNSLLLQLAQLQARRVACLHGHTLGRACVAPVCASQCIHPCFTQPSAVQQ